MSTTSAAVVASSNPVAKCVPQSGASPVKGRVARNPATNSVTSGMNHASRTNIRPRRPRMMPACVSVTWRAQAKASAIAGDDQRLRDEQGHGGEEDERMRGPDVEMLAAQEMPEEPAVGIGAAAYVVRRETGEQRGSSNRPSRQCARTQVAETGNDDDRHETGDQEQRREDQAIAGRPSRGLGGSIEQAKRDALHDADAEPGAGSGSQALEGDQALNGYGIPHRADP